MFADPNANAYGGGEQDRISNLGRTRWFRDETSHPSYGGQTEAIMCLSCMDILLYEVLDTLCGLWPRGNLCIQN